MHRMNAPRQSSFLLPWEQEAPAEQAGEGGNPSAGGVCTSPHWWELSSHVTEVSGLSGREARESWANTRC